MSYIDTRAVPISQITLSCHHAGTGVSAHLNRGSDTMLPIEQAILESLRSGPCCFDNLVTDLPNFTRGEVFVAVDCMSRDGRVSLLQIGYLTYQVSLARGSRIYAPLHDGADVEGWRDSPTPGG